MKRNGLVMRLVTLVLAVLIAFYAIPGIVYVEAAEAISEMDLSRDSGDGNEDGENEQIEAVPLYEETSLRSETTKTFKMSDGSYVAAQYPSAIHRLDSEGKWQDIDNTLALSGSEIKTSDARIKFAKKITGNEVLFTLHDGNYKITFSLDGATKKTEGELRAIESEDDSGSALNKFMSLEKLSSSVIYKNILSGVDVEYILTSNNVKENIIVKEKKENYVYSFTLKLNNLSASLDESGNVEIKNPEGETVYEMPAPIIFDSNGSYAPDGIGCYSLVDNGNGSYSLVVTVDESWMNSADRKFPITIDPTVEYESAFEFSYVDTDGYSAEVSDSYDIYKNYSGSNESAIYWKCNDLNFLPANAYVIDAKFYVTVKDSTHSYIGAYRLLSNFNSENLGSNSINSSPISYKKINLGSYGVGVSFDITELVKLWQMGESYNHGFLLKHLEDDSANDIENVTIYNYNAENANRRPYMLVSYRNIVGIEDYLSYSSHGVGSIAASVNIASGNITLNIPTLATTDSLIPYTPSLIYNTAYSNKYFVAQNFQTAYETITNANGFKWNLQQTIVKKSFTRNYNEIDGYVWCDADGTEHTFLPNDNGEYVDEDGMQLTLEIENSRSRCHIKDKDSNVLVFSKISVSAIYNEEAWRLESIVDKIGNKINFKYTSNKKPQYIELQPYGYTEGITMLEIEYLNDRSPSAIVNEASGETVKFKYSTTYDGSISNSSYKFLREIIRYGTNSMSEKEHFVISYNSSGCITSISETITGYTVNYTYSGKKITKVEEFSNGVAGQSIEYSYHLSYTDVKSYTTEGEAVTRYAFDTDGRTVSVYTTVDGSHIIGAASGVYEEQENVKNNLKESLTAGGSTASYILNGGFEKTDADGTLAYWESGNDARRNWNIDSDGEYYVSFTDFTSEAYIRQSLYLPIGDYSISFDTKSYNAENSGIELKIFELYENGALLGEADLICQKRFAIDANSSSVRSRVSADFSVEYGIKSGNMIMIEISAIPTLDKKEGACIDIDRVSLNEGIGTQPYSLVDGGKFEVPAVNSQGGNTIPLTNFWTPSGQSYEFANTGSGAFDTSYSFEGNLQSNTLTQRIYEASPYILDMYDDGVRNLQLDNDYIISAYARSYNSVGCSSNNASFRIGVVIAYYQGSGEDDAIVTHYYDFLPRCTDWQFVSGAFSTEYESDGYSYDCVKYIDLVCDYSNQPYGSAAFDDVSVVCVTDGNLKKYAYDDNGNLIAQRTFLYEEYYEYDENNRLKRTANNRGEIYDFTYNQNGTVSSECHYSFSEIIYPYGAEDPDELITKELKYTKDYGYNEYGQIISEITRNEVEAKRIRVSYTYSTDDYIFGARLTETDSLGRTIRYFYDENDGKLLAKFNENTGDGTAYEYDSMGRLKSVFPATVTDVGYTEEEDAEGVRYIYNDEGRLSSILTKTTFYFFEYDEFGNTESVSAADKTLMTYEYNEKNGNLASITYGNGLVEEYVYNSLDLVSEIWYTKDGIRTLAFSYTYSANGSLSSVIDYESGLGTVYTYDTAGLKFSSVTYELSDAASNISEQYTYNQDGAISSVYYRYDSGSVNFDVQNIYTYLPGNVISNVTNIAGDYRGGSAYTYDGFGRVAQRETEYHKVENESVGFKNDVSFEYVSSGADTSTEIKKYISEVNGSEPTQYIFDYDDNGNITKIVRDGEEIRYYYDNIGQLIREDNEILNCTYIYAYDNGGNIYSKKYRLTAEGQTPTDLIWDEEYIYSDSTWGDRLVGYDGQTITYDDLGNPLEYYNGEFYSFSWTGRQLTGAVVDGDVFSFTYNESGIRTSKTKNGVETKYYLSGNAIMAEVTGDEIIVYIYDETGSPVGFCYRKGTYSSDFWHVFWYEKNLHGDIVAVYNSEGTKLVSYDYDAWGYSNPRYYNGASKLSVAAKNPFRYRGYYYDIDLELYYLNSRYYDPATRRFISMDDISVVGMSPLALSDKNLYAYCDNNPVSRVDYSGRWWVFANALVGAVVSVASKIVSNVHSDNKWYDEWASAAVGGAVGGIISAKSGNLVEASYLGAAAESVTKEVLSYIPWAATLNGEDETKTLTKENIASSAADIIVDTAANGTANAITGKIASKIIYTNPGWFKPKKFLSSFIGRYAIKTHFQTTIQGFGITANSLFAN